MAGKENIIVTVGREKWRSPEPSDEPFVIMDGTLESGARVVLKGLMHGDHPQEYLTYQFWGTLTTTEFRGQPQTELKFQSFVMNEPNTRAGVVTYLADAPGIGRILAGRLWEAFGSEAVQVLRDEPERAVESCQRLGIDAAIQASEWLTRNKALEACMIELVGLLNGRGFPKNVHKSLIKKYGNRAAEVIRKDPYRLMQERNCGFKRADALYLDLKLPAGKLKRQAYCATYHAAQATSESGDTWVYKKRVEVGLSGAIGGADVKVEKAIRLAERGGIMSVQRTSGVSGGLDFDGDCVWVADSRKSRNETRLADYVVEALVEAKEVKGVRNVA